MRLREMTIRIKKRKLRGKRKNEVEDQTKQIKKKEIQMGKE